MSIEMKRCETCGSFYDLSKDSTCPYCSGAADSVDKTMPIIDRVVSPVWDDNKTMPIMHHVEAPVMDIEKTAPVVEKTEPVVTAAAEDIGKTMPGIQEAPVVETPVVEAPVVEAPVVEAPVVEEVVETVLEPVVEKNVDPVVGWLVCVAGEDKGRDYKIHAENNFIGKSADMDIRILGDGAISDENHATITYDGMNRTFYFAPGASRSIVRLNGKALLMTAELNAYDRIMVGTTELMFVPLCNQDFDWE